MSDAEQVLRKVAWRDLAPWLLLTQTFRLALSTPLVTLGFVGVIAVSISWRISGSLFLPQHLRAGISDLALDHQVLSRWPGGRSPVVGIPALLNLPNASRAPIDPVLDLPVRMVTPFWQILRPQVPWSEFFYYLFGGCLTVAIWALIGGAITRVAVVHLGLEERVGLRDAVGYARRKWTSYFAAPLLPIIGIAMCAFPAFVAGVLMRLDLGVVLAGLLWPIVLLFGLAMAVLGLGLCFGWPLMWGTISSENSDAFDAISRSYAYTFQRPLHYLFYVLVAAVVGILGWFVVWGFVELLIALCRSGATWGASSARFLQLEQAVEASADASSGILLAGFRMVELFEGIVRAVGSAISYTYFWSATSAIYLLLRYDADRTELDEVALDEDSETRFELPGLEEDEAGVVGAPTEAPSGAPSSEETP